MTSDTFVVAAPARTSLPVRGTAARFPVRRVYCIGRNYLAHIREMGEADERDPPIFFQKPADAVQGEGAVLSYPQATEDFQYEAELVVAMGLEGADIAVEAASAHVFGYAVGLDMTRRDLQRAAAQAGHPWENGKSFDSSAPCSEIVPASSSGHPISGALQLKVNGQLRQRADLAQLIWSVPEIVANLSRLYRLMPGDLIFTGTPDGVGALSPGDRIDASIEGIGTLCVTVAESLSQGAE